MQSYRLPNLHADWPFPKVVNPLYSQVASDSLKWINSYKAFTPKQQDKFARINTGILAAFAYPGHNQKELRLSCNLMNILFVVDDVSDVLDGKDAEELAVKILECFK
jgi:hypothetical protein